jgi:hypothetical protein
MRLFHAWYRLMGTSFMFTGDLEQVEHTSIARSHSTIPPSTVRWQRDLVKTSGAERHLSGSAGSGQPGRTGHGARQQA